MSTRSAIFGSQAQHTHEDEEQTNANDAAIVLTTFGCSPLHEVRGTRENFCSCEIGCARNDQSPSRQGRPLGLSSSPPAGEAAPDASKWPRQPSFRPTKLPVILPTPHRTPHLGPNGHRSLNCPSKPNNSKAVNTRFPLELEKVAPRTACIVGSLFASAPAGLHDN